MQFEKEKEMLERDLYGELSVEPNATQKEIIKAYRNKARDVHPDKNPSPEAAARFRKLKEATDYLKDPAKRAKYDSNNEKKRKEKERLLSKKIQEENLQRQFDAAGQHVCENIQDLDSSVEIELTGLLWQSFPAKFGKFEETRKPGLLDFDRKKLYASWKRASIYTSVEAKETFISIVKKNFAGFSVDDILTSLRSECK